MTYPSQLASHDEFQLCNCWDAVSVILLKSWKHTGDSGKSHFQDRALCRQPGLSVGNVLLLGTLGIKIYSCTRLFLIANYILLGNSVTFYSEADSEDGLVRGGLWWHGHTKHSGSRQDSICSSFICSHMGTLKVLRNGPLKTLLGQGAGGNRGCSCDEPG